MYKTITKSTAKLNRIATLLSSLNPKQISLLEELPDSKVTKEVLKQSKSGIGKALSHEEMLKAVS